MQKSARYPRLEGWSPSPLKHPIVHPRTQQMICVICRTITLLVQPRRALGCTTKPKSSHSRVCPRRKYLNLDLCLLVIPPAIFSLSPSTTRLMESGYEMITNSLLYTYKQGRQFDHRSGAASYWTGLRCEVTYDRRWKFYFDLRDQIWHRRSRVISTKSCALDSEVDRKSFI